MTEQSESTPLHLKPSLAGGNGSASVTQNENKDRRRKRETSGPRTARGKERSRRNAQKHGIFSDVALLGGESRAEFDEFCKGFRKSSRPVGALETALVDDLAMNRWRHRRVIHSEIAEIRMGAEFLDWDKDNQHAERANEISEFRILHEGGLIRTIANPIVLESCLELLEELREVIENRGFSPEEDSVILRKLYGKVSSEQWQRTLFHLYFTWLRTAECSEEERQQHGYATPDVCRDSFLEELLKEIKRLERYGKERASIESERMKLEVIRQKVPIGPRLELLIRYEASLDRSFDRTLSQLERLQRLRLGQPVLPKLEVHHSLS